MRWSYKTVHYELKKEGLLGSAFLDESEIERSLNEYGKAGWELVTLLETMDGVTAVFKQPLDLPKTADTYVSQKIGRRDPEQSWDDVLSIDEPAENPPPVRQTPVKVAKKNEEIDDFEVEDLESDSEAEHDGKDAGIGRIRIE